MKFGNRIFVFFGGGFLFAFSLQGVLLELRYKNSSKWEGLNFV